MRKRKVVTTLVIMAIMLLLMLPLIVEYRMLCKAEQQVRDLYYVNRDLESENARLEEREDAMRENLNSVARRFTEEIAALEFERDELQKKLRSKNEILSDMDDLVLSMSRKIARLEAENAELRNSRTVGYQKFVATAYCNCADCCGIWAGGKTAAGTIPEEGRTIAAGPEIPLGTQIEIDGTVYTVEDRGSGITEGRIDIYFVSHVAAKQYGMREVFGRIVRWGYGN